MARDARSPRLIDVPVVLGELDVEGMDDCGERHQARETAERVYNWQQSY